MIRGPDLAEMAGVVGQFISVPPDTLMDKPVR